jgi:H+/Cl- antiporter ClcA
LRWINNEDPVMVNAARGLVFTLAAVCTGLVAILFGVGVDWASAVFDGLTGRWPWLPILLCPSGFAGIVYLTHKYFPGSQGSGIPQAIAALQMPNQADVDSVLSPRIALGKFLLTLAGFAVGGSIGKEGPTVQIGCTIMNFCGRIGLERTRALERLLIMAGGAAGITCAFNAPIAGVVFAIEEMSHGIDEAMLRSIILAAFVSGVTLFGVLGYQPYFGHSPEQVAFGAEWLVIALCAAVAGLAGGCFARVIIAPARVLPGVVNRLALRRPVVFAALCGAVLAGIGSAAHGQVYGSSYGEARAALLGTALPPLDFGALKWAATMVSYLSGIPGGIFAPSLAVGVGVGVMFAHVFYGLPVAALAMVGMAGYFSGVVQSPFTATVIVIEMTSDPAMTVPVGLAALVGAFCSRLVCREPAYHAMAGNFLKAVAAKRARDLPTEPTRPAASVP